MGFKLSYDIILSFNRELMYMPSYLTVPKTVDKI